MSADWTTTSRNFALGMVALTFMGCAQTLPSKQLVTSTGDEAERPVRLVRAQLDFEEVSDRQDPATLHDLLEVAAQHHPEVRAAKARVEIARGKMIQAGLYPNPAFGPNFSQLGDVDNRLGEPGARLIQTIVTGKKLRIAKAAAAHGVEAADWQAITKWYEVVTRVRLSYFELLTALREQDTLKSIVEVSDKAFQATESMEKAGAAGRPDVLRASVELEQNKLKKEVAARRVEAARQNLLTALGRPPLTGPLQAPPRHELEQTPPLFDWNALLDCVRDSSAELQEARALIAQQEKLLARAKAEVIPNLTVTAIPFYESPQRAMHAEIIVTAPIPVFDRNQGNIHAAEGEVAKARAEEEKLELRLTERLTIAYQHYQAARQQVETYRKVVVPKAEDSLKLVQAGYRAGDKKYDYTTVLQAQHVLFQAQLAQTQALGELWRSVSDIAGILQQEDLYAGCMPPERR
jgi:cobalt-zinc-cadmium efflux system outer membrane protein